MQITSQEQHLHVAAADGAPGFDVLAHDIAKEFSLPDVLPTSIVMDEWNGDWDTIYPLSHVRTFITDGTISVVDHSHSSSSPRTSLIYL